MIDFDLHIHCAPYSSCATQTAEQAIIQAKNAGVNVIAVCNHNTITGLNEIRKLCSANGVKLINGIELSVSIDNVPSECIGKVFHLLGYGFELNQDAFDTDFLDIRQSYEERIRKICGYLRSIKYFVDDCTEMRAVREQLLEKGYFQTENEAKNFLMSDDIVMRFPEKHLDSKEAIHLIHRLGGEVFWAHPNRAEHHEAISSQMIPVIADILYKHGIDGLEVFHPNTVAEPGMVNLLLSIVSQKRLKISLGSDTHHYDESKEYFTNRSQLKEFNFDFETLGKTWEDMT
jgi:hypothetical protein